MNSKNTYSMILQAEETGRSIFESAIYGLVVLCVAFTAWQFASNSIVLPGMNHVDQSKQSEVAVEMLADADGAQPLLASRG